MLSYTNEVGKQNGYREITVVILNQIILAEKRCDGRLFTTQLCLCCSFAV